jgi:glucose-6-phosphate dehydrogenase assembly protein OpcA
MAGAVADRIWRASTPEAIDADLAALWREVGRGDTNVARAVMSNLIVFRNPTRAADDDVAALIGDVPLEQVAARHPSRVIVLEHCHDGLPRAPSASAVGILTFGPESARYGVEVIVVRSACPEPSLLSILRRFVRGDIPTTVWWTEDVSAATPSDALVTVGRQLLYDSRRWRDVGAGIAALAPLVRHHRIDLADLNWRRLAPLRRALVHALGPLKADAWRGVDIRVSHAAGEAAMAWLVCGWLRSERCNCADPTAAEAGASAGGASNERDAEALLSVTIGEMTATMSSRAVEVVGPNLPPLVVPPAREAEADAVAAELRSLAPDRALLAALEALVDRFAR